MGAEGHQTVNSSNKEGIKWMPEYRLQAMLWKKDELRKLILVGISQLSLCTSILHFPSCCLAQQFKYLCSFFDGLDVCYRNPHLDSVLKSEGQKTNGKVLSMNMGMQIKAKLICQK